MGEGRGVHRVMVGNTEEGDNFVDPGVDGRTILKWISNATFVYGNNELLTDIITSLFIQLNAQLDCSRKLLILTIKFTLKCSYMFRFNSHHQGAYCCALLKL